MLPVLLLLATALTPLDATGYRSLVRGYRSQVLLVSFWATWCVPCREELPRLAALQKKVPGLRLVTVSADDPEDADKAGKFVREVGIAGPVYIRRAEEADNAFIRAVDPKWSGALPANFLYDRDGKLIRSFVGETPASELEAAVRRAAAE